MEEIIGNTTIVSSYHKCNIKTMIRVTLKNNYYETTYTHIPKHESCEHCNLCHPFLNLMNNEDECEEGEIIVKNPMTTEMINNLLKPKKELEKEIGNTDGDEYKKRILWCISHLWD